MVARPLVLTLSLALGACGGNSGLTTTSTQSVRGSGQGPVSLQLPAADPSAAAMRPVERPELSAAPTPLDLEAPDRLINAATARGGLALLPPPGPAPVSQPGPWRPVGPDLSQCAAPELPGQADVTYVCDCQPGAAATCVAGSDSNPGTAELPLQSFGAAMQALRNLSAGGTVALCRGGRWTSGAERINRNTGCTAQAPCVLADYAAAWSHEAEPAPLVEVDQPGTRYLIGVDAASGQHVNEGLVFRNLTFASPFLEGKGIFLFRTVNDVTMSCLDISGFAVGLQLATAGARNVLSDSHIHDNGEQGYLGGCNDCGVQRSRFANNGFAMAAEGRGQFAHNLYMSPASVNPQVADGMFVRDSYFTRSAVDPQNEQCMGISVTVHGGLVTNLDITGNVVEEPTGRASGGCWGITVDATNFDAERNEDVRIAGNVVRNVGNVSIGLSSCVRCVVENNVVIQQAMGSARGILMPDRARQPEDAVSSDVTMRNNTVYFGGWADGVGIELGGEGEGYTLANNIVAYDGTTGSCLQLPASSTQYTLVDANLCSGGVLSAELVTRDASLDAQAPQFVDAPADLRLQAESPAVDSGCLQGSAGDDLLGSQRGSLVDRGAFERL